MIEADLMINAPCNEQYSQSSKKNVNWITKGMSPGTQKHRNMLWYITAKDKE